MTKLANQVVLNQIKEHVCYTELVYQRVNKKLAVYLSKSEVEALVMAVLEDSATSVEKLGKNYYVTNLLQRGQLVINPLNYRLITVNHVAE